MALITVISTGGFQIWLQLHCAIYRPDSFVLMLRYRANLKAIRSESTSLNRIVEDKSHRATVAYVGMYCHCRSVKEKARVKMASWAK